MVKLYMYVIYFFETRITKLQCLLHFVIDFVGMPIHEFTDPTKNNNRKSKVYMYLYIFWGRLVRPSNDVRGLQRAALTATVQLRPPKTPQTPKAYILKSLTQEP